MKNRYVFAGIGASNIFAILYLLMVKKQDDVEITVIDAGDNPYVRSKKDILYGFGGAGCFSDYKCIYDDNLSIYNNFDRHDIQECHHWIQDFIRVFHSNPSRIHVTIPSVELDELLKNSACGLDIRQSECHHIGSAYARILLQNMFKFMLVHDVNFMFNTRIAGIDSRKSEVVLENGGRMEYDRLFLGLGREGKPFIRKLYRKNRIVSDDNEVHLGVRFETLYNDHIRDISEKQYDFKFYGMHDDIEIRSFCVCHYSAYVTRERSENDGRTYFNGEGYGMHNDAKRNNLTNFGIIGKIVRDNVDRTYTNAILKSIDKEGMVMSGDGCDFKSSDNVDDLRCLTKHTFRQHYGGLGVGILNFIGELDKLFHFNENYRIFLPEIKKISGKVHYNENMTVKGLPDNIHIIGDSGVLNSRGIVPAGVSGILAVK
jgi:uncharacterized FAD-dependent dehydrogenase